MGRDLHNFAGGLVRLAVNEKIWEEKATAG